MVGRSSKGYQGPHNERSPPLTSGVSANKSKNTHTGRLVSEELWETHPETQKVTQANREAYVVQYQLPASKNKMAICCQIHRLLPT